MSEKSKSEDEPKKCCYETGPCKLMKEFAYDGSSETGQGIFARSNITNMRTLSAKMYHGGFFFRSSLTEKSGVFLNFCPWCGADLGKWLEAYSAEFNAETEAWEKEHPDADDKRAAAKAKFEKEREEFLEGLDPDIRKAVEKLSDRQAEALQEAWIRDGRFLHGSDVSASTIRSICKPERGLVDDGRKLNEFGLRVREAVEEIPSTYSLPC